MTIATRAFPSKAELQSDLSYQIADIDRIAVCPVFALLVIIIIIIVVVTAVVDHNSQMFTSSLRSEPFETTTTQCCYTFLSLAWFLHPLTDSWVQAWLTSFFAAVHALEITVKSCSTDVSCTKLLGSFLELQEIDNQAVDRS